MDDMKTILDAAARQNLPLDLLFDGTEPGYAGRLLGTRRVGDAEGLAIEVGSEGAPKVVSVARVRVVVDRVLHEFAVPVVRRIDDPLPVLLTTYPAEIHTVERRSQVRVAPTSASRLRVAVTVAGAWIPVELHNISLNGAAFSSPDVGRFAVGHSVARIELTLDDGAPIVTSGTVRNVYTIRYPREVGPVYGIQWGKLSAADRARLTAYINARRPSPG